MGSGLSAKSNRKFRSQSSDVAGRQVECKSQNSDDFSDYDEDIEDEQTEQPGVYYEEKRAVKLKSLLEENIESRNQLSTEEAMKYLAFAERASKSYGYHRYIAECMANLDVLPK